MDDKHPSIEEVIAATVKAAVMEAIAEVRLEVEKVDLARSYDRSGAAQRMGVSEDQIDRWRSEGLLHWRQSGRMIRILEEDIRDCWDKLRKGGYGDGV